MNSKRRLIITSIISILLVSILLIGSTYSLFTTSDIEEDVNIYKTGNLDITYTVDEDSIFFNNATPISTEEENTITPYRITVTNTGTVPYMFNLGLTDTTASNVIDYKYIMVKVGELESKTLASCTDNIIQEDIIVPAGDSVVIDVRVYLSDSISNSEIGKSFYAKLSVDGLAVYDYNKEIDNGILSLNYMKAFTYDENTGVITSNLYFHDENYEDKIKNVSFVDNIDTSSAVVFWDMSEAEDESIIAWIENSEEEGYYDLYIGSDEFIYAKDLTAFFINMKGIDNISFNNLNTSLTTTMNKMFWQTGSNSTTFSIDFGDTFNTSNVINMDYMFYYTGKANTELTLDLSNFDFSNITTYIEIFYDFRATDTIYVKDESTQSWIITNAGNSNLTTNNVLIKD